jgi:uncharacterized protein
MKSYDYKKRKGIRKISWREFHLACQEIAKKVDTEKTDLIIGIARGGLYPATLIAGMLRKEFYPIRITRRYNDRVVSKRPVWKTNLTVNIKNKRILIVDDIADTGETLAMVVKKAKKAEAGKITTACVVSHSWPKNKPDLYYLESDQLIVFPWDTKILVGSRWQLNSEIRKALNFQK